MKTILIETVSNGWIVKIRAHDRSICDQEIAVFNEIHDLQTALPVLLGRTPLGEYVATPKLDSEGGNTGL